jgi:hypothetical protein
MQMLLEFKLKTSSLFKQSHTCSQLCSIVNLTLFVYFEHITLYLCPILIISLGMRLQLNYVRLKGDYIGPQTLGGKIRGMEGVHTHYFGWKCLGT